MPAESPLGVGIVQSHGWRCAERRLAPPCMTTVRRSVACSGFNGSSRGVPVLRCTAVGVALSAGVPWPRAEGRPLRRAVQSWFAAARPWHDSRLLQRLTRVELEHRAWERLGPTAERMCEMYNNGWPTVITCFDRSQPQSENRPSNCVTSATQDQFRKLLTLAGGQSDQRDMRPARRPLS
jgi:hypothetical protein